MQEGPLFINTSSCSCAPLTAHPGFSPWGKKMRAKGRELDSLLHMGSVFPSHNRVCQGDQHHSQVSTSKMTGSVISGTSDPADSRVSPISKTTSEIPFTFTHQKTPSTSASDYRKAYTYPNMRKHPMFRGVHRHVRGIPQPSSSPNTFHLTKPVRPGLIVLGERYWDEKSETKIPASSPHPKPGEKSPPSSQHSFLPVVQPSRSCETPKAKQMVKNYGQVRVRRLRKNLKDQLVAAGGCPQLHEPLPITMAACNLEPHLSALTLSRHPAVGPHPGGSLRPKRRVHENLSTTTGDRKEGRVFNMKRQQKPMRAKIVTISSPWGES